MSDKNVILYEKNGDDGLYYKSFGYHKVRVPVSDWSGNVTKYIPEENIKENIY